MVGAWGGSDPPALGFSVLCSTDGATGPRPWILTDVARRDGATCICLSCAQARWGALTSHFGREPSHFLAVDHHPQLDATAIERALTRYSAVSRLRPRTAWPVQWAPCQQVYSLSLLSMPFPEWDRQRSARHQHSRPVWPCCLP